VFAIGEDLGLQRQKGPARIDQVDARQPVLERDLLRADVLLHRRRIVGAALHRRVVGDDEHFAPRDAADARDDPGRRRAVVVHVERGGRRELEKRRAGVDELVDPLAYRQLALIAMALQVFRAAAVTDDGQPIAELGDELLHPVVVGLEASVGGVDVRLDRVHPSPPAAIGLEAAQRAAPDRVHAVHLGAASLAQHLVGPERRRRAGLRYAHVGFEWRDGTSGRRRRRLGHAWNYGTSRVSDVGRARRGWMP